MMETPLPDSSELTQEDFIRCGWREIIGNTQIGSCVKVYEEFDKSYKEAYQDGDLLRAKVLLILAGACSMMLTNKSPSKPFVPMWEFDGRSSPTPDWFSESDITFLAEILDNIDQPMLKGRIADLVWLKKTPTDYKFALEAIDNLSIPRSQPRNLGNRNRSWLEARHGPDQDDAHSSGRPH